MGGRTGWKNWINAGARLVLLAAGVYGCLLLLRSSDGIACSPWAVYGGTGVLCLLLWLSAGRGKGCVLAAVVSLLEFVLGDHWLLYLLTTALLLLPPLLWDRYRAGTGAAPGPLSACVLGPAHGGDGQEAVFLWRRRPARYSFGSPPPASPGRPCICGDLPEAPTGTAIGRRRTTAACSLIFRTRWAGGPGGPGSMACFPVCTSCSTALRRQRGGRSL